MYGRALPSWNHLNGDSTSTLPLHGRVSLSGKPFRRDWVKHQGAVAMFMGEAAPWDTRIWKDPSGKSRLSRPRAAVLHACRHRNWRYP